MANPATAVLTQSKRFPLTWDSLRARLPTWRARLPETRDPRDAPWERDEGWVLKPALGRVGEDVLIQGVINDAEWRQVARHVRPRPGQWVAQRRFASSPFEASRPLHACVGVYTVNGRTAGAYGRLAFEAPDSMLRLATPPCSSRANALEPWTRRGSHDL